MPYILARWLYQIDAIKLIWRAPAGLTVTTTALDRHGLRHRDDGAVSLRATRSNPAKGSCPFSLQNSLAMTALYMARNFLRRVMRFFLQGGNDQAIQTHAASRCFERNLTVQVTADPHIE